MKFRPLHDRVVIERIDAEANTAGGIIIPDTAKEKPQEGKVIAVRPRRPRRERQAHPHRREGRRPHPVRQMVGHRGQDQWRRDLIMKESDIMGVLVEAEAKNKKKAA